MANWARLLLGIASLAVVLGVLWAIFAAFENLIHSGDNVGAILGWVIALIVLICIGSVVGFFGVFGLLVGR